LKAIFTQSYSSGEMIAFRWNTRFPLESTLSSALFQNRLSLEQYQFGLIEITPYDWKNSFSVERVCFFSPSCKNYHSLF
jgi:hypothetical protein